jgi:CheY-like chemotaxis protein
VNQARTGDEPDCSQVSLLRRQAAKFDSELTGLEGWANLRAMNIAHQAQACEQPLPFHRPLRVLIVDDNPINRLEVAVLLVGWGLEPSLASDGAEAVRLAKLIPFDLVLMDLAIPVLDGVAATRQIRAFEAQQPTRQAVPIVAHTAMDVAEDAHLLSHAGMNGILQKPVSPNSLDSCIKRWCPKPTPLQ